MTLHFRHSSWHATAWEGMDSLDRHRLLQDLLDGTLSRCDANHAAWRGLGFHLADDGATLLTPDGSHCTEPLPDIFVDTGVLASFEGVLPLDDEDEMECLDVLVETLHGEALTHAQLEAGDPDFRARYTLVRWLYTTQPGVAF